MSSTESYRLGFIPVLPHQKVPNAYKAALLEREDRGLRDGGIFGSGGTPKQAARSLLLARRRIRQPLVAKATGQA
jgi:hypothetical protein